MFNIHMNSYSSGVYGYGLQSSELLKPDLKSEPVLEAASKRPDWKETIEIAAPATAEIIFAGSDSFGTATLIAKDLVIVKYHEIDGVNTDFLKISFKQDPFNSLIGHKSYSIRGIVDYSADQDYAVLALNPDRQNTLPGDFRRIPTLSKDTSDPECILVHTKDHALVASTASTPDMPGASLDHFSNSHTAKGSCGGGNYNKHHELVSIHGASSTGNYGGQEGESAGGFIADIAAQKTEGIINTLSQTSDLKNLSGASVITGLKSLPKVYRENDFYVYESKEKKGLDDSVLQNLEIFSPHFLDKHYATSAREAAEKATDYFHNRNNNAAHSICKFTTEGCLKYSVDILRNHRDPLRPATIYPTKVWEFNRASLVSSTNAMNVRLSNGYCHHVDALRTGNVLTPPQRNALEPTWNALTLQIRSGTIPI